MLVKLTQSVRTFAVAKIFEKSFLLIYLKKKKRATTKVWPTSEQLSFSFLLVGLSFSRTFKARLRLQFTHALSFINAMCFQRAYLWHIKKHLYTSRLRICAVPIEVNFQRAYLYQSKNMLTHPIYTCVHPIAMHFQKLTGTFTTVKLRIYTSSVSMHFLHSIVFWKYLACFDQVLTGSTSNMHSNCNLLSKSH